MTTDQFIILINQLLLIFKNCLYFIIIQVTTNQQVVFTQAQTQPQTVSLNDETRVVFTQAQMQPQTVSLNDETRVVILQQPSQPAVARVSQGYAIPGQLPTVYIPPQVIMLKNTNFSFKSAEIITCILFITERQSAYATKHNTYCSEAFV